MTQIAIQSERQVLQRQPALPAPARLPWIVVGVAAFAMIATLPGRTHGLGLITNPLMRDLHLDRIDYAALNLWATLLGALFCLPWGWLIDRLGARFMLALTLMGLGVVVVMMGDVQGDWIVHASVPVPFLGTWTISMPMDLFLLVLLTRGLGQSALSVVSITLIGRSTHGRPGVVIGIYSFLVAVGFMAGFGFIKFVLKAWEVESLPAVAASSVGLLGTPDGPLAAAATLFNGRTEAGWRQLWSAIGWILVICGPAVWFLARSSGPGEQQRSTNPGNGVPEPISLTLGQALWSPAFWVFGIATSLYGLIAAGISLFNQSVLEERGFDRDVFLTITTLTPMIGLASNLASGWLATRWQIRRILALAMFILMAALVCFPLVNTLFQVYLYATAMGIAGGMVTVIFFAVWSEAYGKSHLGQIQGAAQMLTVLASAVGPLLLAGSKQQTGSYIPFVLLAALLAGVLGVAAWFVPMPNRPTRFALPQAEEFPS